MCVTVTPTKMERFQVETTLFLGYKQICLSTNVPSQNFRPCRRYLHGRLALYRMLSKLHYSDTIVQKHVLTSPLPKHMACLQNREHAFRVGVASGLTLMMNSEDSLQQTPVEMNIRPQHKV